MLLYGSEPLEVATPNMTDYITLQDANMLLKLLAKGPVSVATDTGLPVSHLRPRFWAGPSGRVSGRRHVRSATNAAASAGHAPLNHACPRFAPLSDLRFAEQTLSWAGWLRMCCGCLLRHCTPQPATRG